MRQNEVMNDNPKPEISSTRPPSTPLGKKVETLADKFLAGDDSLPHKDGEVLYEYEEKTCGHRGSNCPCDGVEREASYETFVFEDGSVYVHEFDRAFPNEEKALETIENYEHDQQPSVELDRW